MVRTGPDGRFTLHSTVDNYLLVAAGDAGYADASQDEFARSGKLVLKPWGKIEGVVWVGDRPGADQEIVYNNDISPRGGRPLRPRLRLPDQDQCPGPVRV